MSRVEILNYQENDTVAGLFDSTPDPVSFPPNKHPLDYFMAVERSTRADLILHNPSIVGYIIFLEGNLTKHFLPERITNFETNVRTIVFVSGTCLQNPSTKAFEKDQLSDCLHFAVNSYHALFPSEEVSDFLIDPDNLANNPPPLLAILKRTEKNTSGGGSLDPSAHKRSSDSRRTDYGQRYDRILGFLSSSDRRLCIFIEHENLVESIYLNKRQSIPKPQGKCSQTRIPSMKVLMRNEEHPRVEYECIRRSIRLVRAENERVYTVANPTDTSVLRIIDTKGYDSFKIVNMTHRK